jgi:hypothetical protein
MFHFIQVWWTAEREARDNHAKEKRQKEREREARLINHYAPHPNVRHGLNLWVDEDGFLRARAKSSWVG